MLLWVCFVPVSTAQHRGGDLKQRFQDRREIGSCMHMPALLPPRFEILKLSIWFAVPRPVIIGASP